MDDAQLRTIWQQRQVGFHVKHLSTPLTSYLKHDLSKRVRQIGKLAEIWQDVVPPELAGHTSLETFRRGVLTVTVDSSSHLFMLRTLLDGGLKREIQSRFSGAINRIKLLPGASADPGIPGRLGIPGVS